MREAGLAALTPRQLTSRPTKEHPTYPYLLRTKPIRYPNQVWATDITYLKSYESVRELKRGLARYIRFYNERRYHQSLDYQTPAEMHESFRIEPVAPAA